MKNIIIPVDFSQQSENALKIAASLAQIHGATLLVLHMLELSPAIVSESEYIAPEQMVHLLKTGEKRFNSFLDKPYLKGLKITPIIKHYKVFSEVNDVAKQHEADLVVMGSHGTDGLQEIFIGSNTERVVRSCEVPVLVIKENTTTFHPKRFVFACDFKEETIPALNKAIAMGKQFGSEMHFVYINVAGDRFLSTADIQSRISKLLETARLEIKVDIYNDYTVEKGVFNYSEKVSADLIGIPTHGRRGLSHFLMGSIGESIANHSKIPVITFKI